MYEHEHLALYKSLIGRKIPREPIETLYAARFEYTHSEVQHP